MLRGEIYRTVTPPADPRPRRLYVVVSRAAFLRVNYSSVVCVPIYSGAQGLPTEVMFDSSNGLRHPSFARCDEATSVPRAALRQFVGTATGEQLQQLTRALAVALGINPEDISDL